MLERRKIDPELSEQSWDTESLLPWQLSWSLLVDKPSSTEKLYSKKGLQKIFKELFEKELKDAAGV